MSQFRDTFTKQEKNEPLLDYDDSAFLFFVASLCVAALIPWTYSLITRLRRSASKRFPEKSAQQKLIRYCKCCSCQEKLASAEGSRWRRNITSARVSELLAYVLLVVFFIYIYTSLRETREIQRFDPYEILELAQSATTREIKKAYRMMSLTYHPDKNTNDPTAGAKFMLITKAYAALTDEVAKENYAKYGNPDGPGNMKVGIGLPRFLVEERFQLLILCVFFLILLVIIPMLFIWYYQKQKKYYKNGIQRETIHILTSSLSIHTRSSLMIGLLTLSGESREQNFSRKDVEMLKPVFLALPDMKKGKQPTNSVITRNTALLSAHIHGLRDLVPDSLRSALNELLQISFKLCDAMFEISLIRGWIGTAQASIELNRALTQGLSGKSAALAQIPHFDDEVIKHATKGKNGVKDIREFIRKAPEDRKGLAEMSPQQVADVCAFCSHVPNMTISAKIYVEDETEICNGDIATVEVTLIRENLKEDEEIGPVHAPFVNNFMKEKWRILLCTVGSKPELLTYKLTEQLGRTVVENLTISIQILGTYTLGVHAYCDNYEGLDVSTQVTFKALSPGEAGRKIVMHPDDEALDREPTLFQQMVGQLDEGDSSDDEETRSKKSDSSGEEKEEEGN